MKHRTIFHDLLDSPTLPEQDKSVDRLWQEAQLFLAAGTVTTATSISAALVYLLLDKPRLQVLLEELENAVPNIATPPKQAQLERLPYLVIFLCRHSCQRKTANKNTACRSTRDSTFGVWCIISPDSFESD